MKPHTLTFKTVFYSLLVSALCALPSAQAAKPDWQDSEAAEPIAITVYKSPTCGCCGDWNKHLEAHNFKVTALNRPNMSAVKKLLGVPQNLQSCHTAIVDGYLVEGHVPASDIIEMLNSKSSVKGIAVPAMPVGSPGMEMGERKDSFKVVGFHKNGDQEVIKEYQDY